MIFNIETILQSRHSKKVSHSKFDAATLVSSFTFCNSKHRGWLLLETIAHLLLVLQLL